LFRVDSSLIGLTFSEVTSVDLIIKIIIKIKSVWTELAKDCSKDDISCKKKYTLHKICVHKICETYYLTCIKHVYKPHNMSN